MRELKLLRIVSIIKPDGFGDSKPIIVTANDDKTYVLKTREDGTNPKDLGIFNELLGYQLHDFLLKVFVIFLLMMILLKWQIMHLNKVLFRKNLIYISKTQKE